MEDYVYLGVIFRYNGFKRAIDEQINQAQKAMFLMQEKVGIFTLPFDIVYELYDKCVIPVLLYGCEVWGSRNIRDVEISDRNFLSLLLEAFEFTVKFMLHR